MATFNDLYDYVMPYLPGAEPALVDFHIRRALREFFKRTAVWQQVFEFPTVVGADTYELIPTDGIVAEILRVDIGGRYASAVPEDRRDPFVAPATPSGWYTLLPHVITLYPKPDKVVTVRVEAAMSVSINGSDRAFPDSVMAVHAENIAAGAVAGMMMMPGKPWTQRDAAAIYSRIFGSAIRDTRGKLRDGGQPNQSTFTGARRFGV